MPYMEHMGIWFKKLYIYMVCIYIYNTYYIDVINVIAATIAKFL